MKIKTISIGVFLLIMLVIPIRFSYASEEIAVPGIPKPTCVPVPEWGQTCDDKPVPKNKPVAPVIKIEKSDSQTFNTFVKNINRLVVDITGWSESVLSGLVDRWNKLFR